MTPVAVLLGLMIAVTFTDPHLLIWMGFKRAPKHRAGR